jgi:hypothetical protein
MNSELKGQVSAPIDRSARLPAALAMAAATFCSIRVRDFPTGVSCSLRFVAPSGKSHQGKRDHRTDA